MQRELYLWTLGGEVFRQTSGLLSVSHASQTWAPAKLARTEITHGTDSDGARVVVTVARDHEVALRCRAVPPDTASLEILRDRGDGFVRVWSGRLTSVRWAGSRAEITSESPLTVAAQRGLWRGYQLACRHRFGDHRCNAQPFVAGSQTAALSFLQDYEVLEVAGSRVRLDGLGTFVAARVTAYPANGARWYLGGAAVWSGRRRLVVDHDGDWITMSAPMPGLAVGQTLQVVAGCSHSLAECHAKFRNADNFGGFPLLPLRNPSEGTAS
jgi:uncharacterized phage protein (TIGR02218 family)